MALREIGVKKDNNTRKVGDDVKGNGKGATLGVGRAGDFVYRAYIEFDLDWSNVGQLVGADIELTIEDNLFENGHGPNAQAEVHRVTDEWAEGGAGWSHADKVYSQPDNSRQWRSEIIAGGVGSKVTIGCLDLVMQWAPGHITKYGTNETGKGKTNHGILLESVFQDRSLAQFEVASQENNSAGKRPLLIIDYVPQATPPSHNRVDPTDGMPTNNVDFKVDFSDSNPDDYLTAVGIRLRRKDNNELWEMHRGATSSERAEGRAEVNVHEVLPAGQNLLGQSVTHYEWKARLKDNEGLWSEWDSGWREFWVTNIAPSVTADAPEMGTFRTLDNVYLKATYLDPDGDSIAAMQLQARAWAHPADPAWGSGSIGLLWDTGLLSPTVEEFYANKVIRLYGGKRLYPGSYTVRVRVMDTGGALSDWAYMNFSLTEAYEPVPGVVPLLSGYARKSAQWRIILYAMGEQRRPGTIKAIITDAAHVGCSQMANDVGEFYFTLPATHPQVGECEPYQRHYSFQQFRGNGWVPIFEGILTDFDANEDDVVVYGMDYMGLLSLSVDVRASQGQSPDLPVEKGGSKYVNKHVSYVITDQLRQAKAQTDSPLGFITVDTDEIDDVAERITIFSSFKQRLDFIISLIQSIKSGTGRTTRLWPVRVDEDSYRWRFRLVAGQDRPDLTLRFGELVQGYRVLVMGDFATTVHGIGRIYDEVKPRYFAKTGPGLNTATWGLSQRAAVWNDLSDLDDFKRRVQQMAAEVGRVGKRMALGLRVTGIEPFDGWGLLDSVPVEIDHGVVDTSKYGSGMWTIHGVEYRVFPDGHDELTLVILPREDEHAPDDDLIDGDPIKPREDIESGKGKPKCENHGTFYYDTDSGILYRRCTQSSYCYCPTEPEKDPLPYSGRNPWLFDDFNRTYTFALFDDFERMPRPPLTPMLLMAMGGSSGEDEVRMPNEYEEFMP